eukprot:scaffold18782_cov118-Isochrysis_galbana.AAC.2
MEPLRAAPPANDLGRPLIRGRAEAARTLNVMDFNPPRQCRDVKWLGLLLLCWACMLVIAVVAVVEGAAASARPRAGPCARLTRTHTTPFGLQTRVPLRTPSAAAADAARPAPTGDLMRLEAGMDTDNHLCGVDRPDNPEEVRSRRYVYFACLPYGLRHPTICTAECPHMSGQYVRWYNGSLISCELDGRTIPATTYPTTHLERNCVPSAASLYALVSTEIDESAFPSIVEGMRKADWLVAACCGGAAVLALLWIAAARTLSAPGHLAATTVSLTVVSLLLLSGSLWFQSNAASAVAEADSVLQGSLQVATNSDMTVGLALAASVFAIGVIIVLWCGLLSRLLTAGGILVEATEALRAMPALVLALPPVLAVAVVAVFAYWLLVALYVASAGTPHHGVLKYDETLRWFIWLHTLGVLWTVEVVLHLGFCATAGLMVRWYFGAAQAEGGVAGGGGLGLLCATVGRTLRYSAGSLAIGSLLIIPVRRPAPAALGPSGLLAPPQAGTHLQPFPPSSPRAASSASSSSTACTRRRQTGATSPSFEGWRTAASAAAWTRRPGTYSTSRTTRTCWWLCTTSASPKGRGKPSS